MKYAKTAKLYAKRLRYLLFQEFVDKYGLKNEATSNIKIQQILNELHLPTKVYMRDDTFSTDSGIVNLHPTKGTHWVIFSDKFYFDSYGCPPPTNIQIKLKKVLIQNVKFRKMIVIVQRIVYTFYILRKL